MQTFPMGPEFQAVPFWLGSFLLLAAGLAFLAFVAVLTAVLATGKPIVPMQRIKTLAAMLLLIVPALAVVGLVGWFWSVPSTPHRESRSARRHPAVTRAEIATTRSASSQSRSPNTITGSDPSVVGDSASIVRTSLPNPIKSISTVDEVSTKSATIVEAEESPSGRSQQSDAGVAPFAQGETGGQAEGETRLALEAAKNTSGEARSVSMTAPPLTGVLRVRGTASAPPEWAGKDPLPGTDGVLVALSSQRFATIGEAEEQVTGLAVDYVKKFYHDEYPLRGDWTVPVSVIEQNALNAIVGEMFDKDFGNGVTGMMYRAHVRLDINSALRKALHASWNDQLVTHRLVELGGILGLATLVLATCAGYFRVDDWTGGNYRRRLKLAAASLLAAGGLITTVCVLMA